MIKAPHKKWKSIKTIAKKDYLGRRQAHVCSRKPRWLSQNFNSHFFFCIQISSCLPSFSLIQEYLRTKTLKLRWHTHKDIVWRKYSSWYKVKTFLFLYEHTAKSMSTELSSLVAILAMCMIFPRMTSFIENSRWCPDLLNACIETPLLDHFTVCTFKVEIFFFFYPIAGIFFSVGETFMFHMSHLYWIIKTRI